jgi:hypothetical protein
MSFTAFPVLASLLSSAGLLAAPIGLQVGWFVCVFFTARMVLQATQLCCGYQEEWCGYQQESPHW